MAVFVDIETIEGLKNIDPQNVYGSVIALSAQVKDAWEKASSIEIPEDYSKVENIVMCGMGGSGLGARVIETVFGDKLKIPLIRVNDYHLPAFVNEKSLVFCSSYSGSTEETLQNVAEAKEKGCKWLAIGTGGKLIELAQDSGVPFYQINPTLNPSDQPRMAVGYSIIGQLALLAKIGLISITTDEITKAVGVMDGIIAQNKVEIAVNQNPAKTLAAELLDKIPILISSEHLIGATHIFNNQLNENSKNMSFDFVIPELNHHLMEGLAHPEANDKNLFCLFIGSNLYSERIQKRFEVTKDVVSKNNILYSDFTTMAEDKLTQVFELIQFGAFVNYYLSALYRQNPAPIPWVDYFKEKLAK
jgi:glucose/mannose-6-phosphate isomerase